MFEYSEHKFIFLLFFSVLVFVLTYIGSWVVLGIIIQAGTKFATSEASAFRSFGAAGMPALLPASGLTVLFIITQARGRWREFGSALLAYVIVAAIFAIFIWAFF